MIHIPFITKLPKSVRIFLWFINFVVKCLLGFFIVFLVAVFAIDNYDDYRFFAQSEYIFSFWQMGFKFISDILLLGITIYYILRFKIYIALLCINLYFAIGIFVTSPFEDMKYINFETPCGFMEYRCDDDYKKTMALSLKKHNCLKHEKTWDENLQTCDID